MLILRGNEPSFSHLHPNSSRNRSAHAKDRIYFLRKIEHRKVHVLQLHCRDVFFFGALPHGAELRWVFQLIISCGCTCHVAEICRSTRLSGTTFEMQRSIEELLCFSLPWCGLVPTNSHFGPWILRRFQHLSRQKLPGQSNVNSWDSKEETLLRIE